MAGARLLVAALLVSASLAPAAAQTFNRAAWIADFEALKGAITARSPNLEWQAARGLDLATMEARARTRLAAATTDAAARDAFDRFVRNFADGHMELRWPGPPQASTAAPADIPAAPPTCDALGYRPADLSGSIARTLPGYRALGPAAGSNTEAGVVTVAGRIVGVLTIAQFSPSRADCEATLRETGRTSAAPCPDDCAEYVGIRSDNRLLAAAAAQIRALAAARPDALLVDLAGNGGGNDTAIALARMVGGADVPTPELAYTRTPARAASFADTARELREAAVTETGATAQHLRASAAIFDGAAAQARTGCDLAPLWSGRAPGCSNLVRGFHAAGLVPFDLDPTLRAKPWADRLSATVRLHYTAARWPGPVLVLVDGDTASAAELFAAMLQDAGRAAILGAPTFGAGCGWTLPPQPVTLPNSRASLAIPDCARLRADGRNEIDGVEPDRLIAFRRYDTPAQRTVRLARALPAALGPR